MQTAIAHIRKELETLYPSGEVDSFIYLIMEHVKSYNRTEFLLAKNEILSNDEQSQKN